MAKRSSLSLLLMRDQSIHMFLTVRLASCTLPVLYGPACTHPHTKEARQNEMGDSRLPANASRRMRW